MNMMGTPIGISEKNTSVTKSPANMLAKRRMVSDNMRARWLMISIGIIKGAKASIGPMNCLK